MLDYHDLLQVDKPRVFGIGITILTQCKMGLFRAAAGWEGDPQRYTYSTIMKLATVIP